MVRMTNARRAATGLFILLSVALAATCSNPVNLLVELEREVMRANDRFLVVEEITVPLGSDNTFIPTGTITIKFDRQIDFSSVSSESVVIMPVGGEPLVYTFPADAYTAELRSLAVKVEPFLNPNTDFIISVLGVKGSDGSAIDLEATGISRSFKTTNILAGSIESVVPDDATSNPGFTKSSGVTLDLEVSTNLYQWIKYRVSADVEGFQLVSNWVNVWDSGFVSLPPVPVDLASDLGAIDGVLELTVEFFGNEDPTDMLEKAGMAPTATIVMDRVAPAAPAAPDLTAASDTGASESDNVTKLSTGLVFNGNLGAGEAGSTLTLLVDGVEEATAVADATGAWEATVLSALVDGARSVTATVSDAAGWISDPSGELSVTIDATVPLPGTWAVGASEYVNTTTHDISASVVPSTDVVEMAFSNDGMAWSPWEAYMATRTDWDFADGAYGGNAIEELKTIHVQVRDLAGNEASTSDTVRYDVTAPVLSSFWINGTGDGTHAYVNTVNTTIAVTATDASPLEYSYDSGGGWSAWSTSTACALPAGDGEKTVNLQVRDRAGNQATGPLTDAIILDTLAPSGVAITSPTGGIASSLGLTIEGAGAAYDLNGIWKADFYVDATLLGSDALAPFTSTWNTTTYSEGAHGLKVRAYDKAGNYADSAAVSVTVNNFDVYEAQDMGKLLGLADVGATRAFAASQDFKNMYLALTTTIEKTPVVMVVYSLDSGQTWTPSLLNPTGTSGGSSPAIVLDGSYLHVLYVSGSELYYAYSKNNGGTWTQVGRLATDVFAGSQPVMGLLPGSTLAHVLYVNLEGVLTYGSLPLGNKVFSATDRLYGPATSPAISVTESGVHVAAFDSKAKELIYSLRDETTGKEILAPRNFGPTDAGDYPSIAAGPLGEVLALCGDGASNEVLWSVFSADPASGKWYYHEVAGKVPYVEVAATAVLGPDGKTPVYHAAFYSLDRRSLSLGRSEDMGKWASVTLFDDLINEGGRGPSMLSDGRDQFIVFYDSVSGTTVYQRVRLNF